MELLSTSYKKAFILQVQYITLYNVEWQGDSCINWKEVEFIIAESEESKQGME